MPIVVPPKLLHFAGRMRQEPSSAESNLWNCLRDRQLGGYKFRRQRPVPPFVVDFRCVALGLAIEADGDSHADQVAYDDGRTVRLDRDGLQVLRFTNADVRWNLDQVLNEILLACERVSADRRPSPQPSPGVPGEGA